MLHRMTLADDLHTTAVAAVERALADALPDVPPDRLTAAADAAVAAAAPFLDGTELERVNAEAHADPLP